MEPSNILILGGCGFIGRNLVSHLVDNNLVKYLRIVDKVPPQIAWLGKSHEKHFQDPKVEFKSGNLINADSCRNAFIPPNDVSWDYVINCAGETKDGQTDAIYKEGILKLSINCAKEAARYNVKRYVELSSGQVFSSDKTSHKEDDDVHPWTYVAKWKLEVEKDLAKIPNLNYSIVRPALVYGCGDKNGLMTRVIIASIYRQLNETLKLLWNASLKINTIHVTDVCRAICMVCVKENAIGETYNIVDEANSTQGSLSQLISELYNLKIEYYGFLMSSMVELSNAADEANDKHMTAWACACSEDDIQNTPLSPHMDFEMLLHKHLHLDGGKIGKLGFECSVPRPTTEKIKETIEYFRNLKVFPIALIP